MPENGPPNPIFQTLFGCNQIKRLRSTGDDLTRIGGITLTKVARTVNKTRQEIQRSLKNTERALRRMKWRMPGRVGQGLRILVGFEEGLLRSIISRYCDLRTRYSSDLAFSRTGPTENSRSTYHIEGPSLVPFWLRHKAESRGDQGENIAIRFVYDGFNLIAVFAKHFLSWSSAS